MITKLDFVAVPSQDGSARARSTSTRWACGPTTTATIEFWVGETCFGIWEPARYGHGVRPAAERPPRPCTSTTSRRPARSSRRKGVEFIGETMDTGVCHMAFFADPDGNDLMLHSRYAPYEDQPGAS